MWEGESRKIGRINSCSLHLPAEFILIDPERNVIPFLGKKTGKGCPPTSGAYDCNVAHVSVNV
jgi:hypothetical protein